MPIDAGKLRHRIEIQENKSLLEPDKNRNEYNEEPPKWESVATRWASVGPLSANESLVAEQVQGFTNHKVVMRYFKGLQAKRHRVKFRERYFNISSILNTDEIGEEMVLMVTEKV